MSEAVNHPSYYGGADNPYEAIKVIEAWLGPEGARAFCLGNTIKYVSRAGKKDENAEAQDLKKAAWYLNRAIGYLEQTKDEASFSTEQEVVHTTIGDFIVGERCYAHDRYHNDPTWYVCIFNPHGDQLGIVDKAGFHPNEEIPAR